MAPKLVPLQWIRGVPPRRHLAYTRCMTLLKLFSISRSWTIQLQEYVIPLISPLAELLKNIPNKRLQSAKNVGKKDIYQLEYYWTICVKPSHKVFLVALVFFRRFKKGGGGPAKSLYVQCWKLNFGGWMREPNDQYVIHSGAGLLPARIIQTQDTLPPNSG